MRDVMRWTGRIVVGLVALILLAYVVKGLVGTLQVSGAQDEARESVALAERDTDAVERTVQANRQVLGDPLRSWSQVVCELGSHDSGWVVNSWYQSCELRRVDVYPADLDRAEDLDDGDHRVSVSDSPDGADAYEPLPAKGKYPGSGSTAATAPTWSVRGDLPGERYTVVTVSGPAAETDLGCSPWGIIFCNEPVDRPAMPE